MGNEVQQRPYRVLVVDDEKPQLAAVGSLVADELVNVEVKTAETLEEAEKLLQDEKFPFDLAIIDLRLDADAEGIVLTKVIRRVLRRHLQTPVIVFTAYPTWQNARDAFESGADAFISKLDVDATDQLRRKVRELVERRMERQELARQMESQERAEAAFKANRTKWGKECPGRFLLVRDGRVVGAYASGHDALEALGQSSEEEKLETGIIDTRREFE